ncbi:hypothetical protein [Amycolatopsis alba]|uniref:Uncharacterized protein n=1 Tax=Amycolatopsis alba DSM 44262 TaxID=1125972 RepID=A0A229RLH2_AMYAL|nr:hypothetical protein [Amycolatopsis alba]OXM47512.1 hypothetical protein CFP75_23805 [Amycolatopsis alba DSM 44262]
MTYHDGDPTTPHEDLGTPIYDELAGVNASSTEDNLAPARAAEPLTADMSKRVVSAIVLDLFGRIAKIDSGDGWNGGDLVNTFTAWLNEFGIHEDADEASAASALRVPAWLTRSLNAPRADAPTVVIHLRTDHPRPVARVRPYLADMVHELGEHSSVAVFDLAGDQVASIVHVASAAEQP